MTSHSDEIPVADVEDALRAHPAVADVALIGLPDGRGGETLCAVARAAPGHFPALEDLRDFLLAEGMTPWCLPQRLEIVPELPRNEAGKVRKAALRQAFQPGAPGQRSLPFGSAADRYDRLRFFPSDEAVSWLLRGNERRVLDLAAGTGQVTGQLIPRGLDLVAVEPDERMREAFSERYPDTECLDGTAERIPLADDSLDAVVVSAAWHWFDAPAALAEIARVLRGRGRLGVTATSVDTRVGWVRGMFTDVSLRAQQRGIDAARNVTLPSADFSGVEETILCSGKVMDVADVVAWFQTHSTYRNADDETRTAMEDRAARVLHEVFPGERAVEMPVMTLCWRAERLPRSRESAARKDGRRGF